MTEAAGPASRPVRAAVIGASERTTCGMRDHAVLLAGALEAHGVSCSMHWLWRSETSFGPARAEFGEWTRALGRDLEEQRAEAIVFHYSVFSYAHRGLPVFVAPTVRALRSSRLPVVTILHEYVYPWGRGGLRGRVWSLSQGAALRPVMSASSAAVVTAPYRAGWLSSRPWLPRREIALAPVFSNLPAPNGSPGPTPGKEPRVGLFGYAYEGADAALVLDALGTLRGRGVDARLVLLGAPGPDSEAAESWRAGARQRGFEEELSFSGVLPAQDLSNTLAACDVLLHPEPSGPTSRKGTLAGSLASGAPVVAIDGPRSWQELTNANAALVVAPAPRALADGIASLLADERARSELGARGRAFAEQAMGLERSAVVVSDLLARLVPGER